MRYSVLKSLATLALAFLLSACTGTGTDDTFMPGAGGGRDSGDGSGTPIRAFDLSWPPQAAAIKGIWHMDGTVGNAVSDNDSVVDSSGLSNHGVAKDTDNSNTMTIVTGKIGEAIRFPAASDAVDMATVNDDINTSEGTISFWLYREFPVGDPSSYDIVSGLTGVNAIYFAYIHFSDLFQFQHNGGGTLTSTAIADADLPLSTWVHVAFTWSKSAAAGAGEVKIYLNGVQKGVTGTTMGNWNAASANFWLAGSQFGGTCKCAIDEMAIWTVALSPAEVATIYDRQSP